MDSTQPKQKASILILDDQAGIRRTLELLFGKEGYRVASCDSAANIGALLGSFAPDVVLTDLKMEPVSGLDVLRVVRAERPGTPVVLMTAFGSIATAVDAMKLGAVDFITKPFKNEDLLIKIGLALDARRAGGRREVQGEPLHAEIPEHRLVARSTALRAVIERIEKIANSRLTVLITGETGTGKSMIAQEIHRRSPFSNGPFVPVNVAALPEPLLESELFGHEKGAFTGATTSRPGLFEAAAGGTLFLDEIGTLPANLQAKLLGVLQDHQVRRVGGNTLLSINVRVIAATNADLERAVERGEFRQDLFYRLNVARLRIPPLREHREDLPFILKSILDELSQDRPVPYAISPDALALLNDYPFPGNVRELRNAIEWATTVAQSSIIEPQDLPEVIQRTVAAPPSGEQAAEARLADVEREQILRTLQRLGGNLTEVARTLGIGRTTLWRKLREYGIKK